MTEPSFPFPRRGGHYPELGERRQGNDEARRRVADAETIIDGEGG